MQIIRYNVHILCHSAITAIILTLAEVQQIYNYYGDYEEAEERNEEEDLPRSGIEWFDARSRQRRDTTQNTQNDVVYTVCVRWEKKYSDKHKSTQS